MVRALLTGTLLVFVACQAQPEPGATDGQESVATEPLSVAINDFLQEHGDLGSVTSVEPVPDWAQGERRRVRLTSGSYLFYFYEGRVVTVYRDGSDGRVEIFREDIPAESPIAEGERPISKELPAYEILDSVETISDGGMADVLVSSYSRETSVAEREDFAEAVASKEGLAWVTLYCSREAFRANYSSSFSESHPGALESCYLGDWKRDRGFSP